MARVPNQIYLIFESRNVSHKGYFVFVLVGGEKFRSRTITHGSLLMRIDNKSQLLILEFTDLGASESEEESDDEGDSSSKKPSSQSSKSRRRRVSTEMVERFPYLITLFFTPFLTSTTDCLYLGAIAGIGAGVSRQEVPQPHRTEPNRDNVKIKRSSGG